MKILIVPDVHGREFWRPVLNIIDKYDKVIFLGDYLDPYPSDGISPPKAFEEFLSILDLKNKYPDKVTLLLGNHDLHYINRNFVRSTRYNTVDANLYYEVFNENKDLFKIFDVVESDERTNIFCHAGITLEWLRYKKMLLAELLEKSLDELLESRVLEDVSWFRGGYNEYGSPVWADARELAECSTVLGEDTEQFVGHTMIDMVYRIDGISFTDCQKLSELDTTTNELKYAKIC